MTTSLPPVVLQRYGQLTVARDDLLEGGTKRRALLRWLPERPEHEFVYGATVYGLAGLALAHACKATGKKATLFFSKTKTRPAMFDRIEQLGGEIMETDVPVPLADLCSLADTYAQETSGAFLVPAGCNHPDFIRHIADVLRDTDYTPAEVWSSAVTGTFSRALQMAWPDATHQAVCVVKHPEDTGRAKRHFAPEKYHQAAEMPPPYPAFPQCDAKIWEFALQCAKKDALVWNIGA